MGIRAFLALEIEDRAQELIGNIIGKLSRQVPPGSIQWARPSNLHLTLHFLGNDVAEAAIETIQRQGAAVVGNSATPGDLSVRKLGTFPAAPRVAQVIYASGSGPAVKFIQRLRDQLGDLLTFCGLPVDSRPWQPHITIGRVKAGRSVRLAPIDIPLITIPIHGVTLIRSTLTPAGPRYEQLKYFPFPPRDGPHTRQ